MGLEQGSQQSSFAAGPRPGLLDSALSGGWTTFKSAWPLLLVASLVAFAGAIPGQAVSQVGQFVGTAMQQAGASPGAAAVLLFGSAFVGLLLGVLVQWPAQVGAMVAALCAARGETASFGATLTGFRRMGTSILVMLLLALCGIAGVLPGMVPLVIGVVLVAVDGMQGAIGPTAIVGFVLIAVGGVLAIGGSLYVTARTVLAPMRALDPQLPKVGAVEALVQTWGATRGNVLPIVGIMLIASVVLIAGLLACCVGIVLFGMPLWLAWLAGVYRVLFDAPVAPAVSET